MQQAVIDVAADFSRYPAGRYRADGHFSGERFRDEILIPALKTAERVRIILDGTRGYGSSFLEEAFAGIVRTGEFDSKKLLSALELVSDDPSLIEEIKEYITATRH